MSGASFANRDDSRRRAMEAHQPRKGSDICAHRRAEAAVPGLDGAEAPSFLDDNYQAGQTTQMSFGFFHQRDTRLVAAEAWYPDASRPNGRRIGILAILSKDIELLKERGENTALAQLQSILLPGLVLTRHVFEGLRRPLLCDGSREADQKKLIYSRKPALDIVVEGTISSGMRTIQRRPPDCRVFCVIVSPNERHRDEFPDVDGWLDRWSWVKEDASLPEAPQNWIDRYDRKVLTIADSERVSE